MGELINFGAAFSAFGSALACAVGASRILFALGRDAGPAMLRRTSQRTGAPVGALIWVGVGSLLTVLVFVKETLATHAVAISPAYGSDLIIAAYILVIIAAITFTVRRRNVPRQNGDSSLRPRSPRVYRREHLRPAPRSSLQLGRARRRDHAGRGARTAVCVPSVAPGIRKSPLLKAGASALLGASDPK